MDINKLMDALRMVISGVKELQADNARAWARVECLERREAESIQMDLEEFELEHGGSLGAHVIDEPKDILENLTVPRTMRVGDVVHVLVPKGCKDSTSRGPWGDKAIVSDKIGGPYPDILPSEDLTIIKHIGRRDIALARRSRPGSGPDEVLVHETHVFEERLMAKSGR